MEAPLTSCGCFECIMVLVPEANGFMIVSREDPSMTPCGMTFSTLAGTAGGGNQTPGMMGMGKYYLTSKKFIPADGGMRRVVWMSSLLKVQMAAALEEVCVREGMPDLMDRIADETCRHHGGGAAAVPGGEGPPGADDGPALLMTAKARAGGTVETAAAPRHIPGPR